MNLIIRRMAPSFAEDYFDFFDNRAFTDHSPYYPCYCNFLNMSEERRQKEVFDQVSVYGGGVEGRKMAARRSAELMVAQSEIQGYLAYDSEIPVGWCNANDKCSYFFPADDDFCIANYTSDENCPKKIKSVVCFEIAPEYRGKGIATALLKQVCEDAKKEHYDIVESYPVIHNTFEPYDFTGPVHIYEKAGFVRIARQGNVLVMQKNLT